VFDVAQRGKGLRHASEELKNDREVVWAAVNDIGRALRFASEDPKNGREIVLAAVNQEGGALMFGSFELQTDRKVALAAVNQCGMALGYVSEDLRNDREVYFAAVNSWGLALQYVSEALRSHPEVYMAAIRNEGSAVAFAPDEARADRAIMLTAVTAYHDVTVYCDYPDTRGRGKGYLGTGGMESGSFSRTSCERHKSKKLRSIVCYRISPRNNDLTTASHGRVPQDAPIRITSPNDPVAASNGPWQDWLPSDHHCLNCRSDPVRKYTENIKNYI